MQNLTPKECTKFDFDIEDNIYHDEGFANLLPQRNYQCFNQGAIVSDHL